MKGTNKHLVLYYKDCKLRIMTRIPGRFRGDLNFYVLSWRGNLVFNQTSNLKRHLDCYADYDFLYRFEHSNEACKEFIRDNLFLKPCKREERLEMLVKSFRNEK